MLGCRLSRCKVTYFQKNTFLSFSSTFMVDSSSSSKKNKKVPKQHVFFISKHNRSAAGLSRAGYLFKCWDANAATIPAFWGWYQNATVFDALLWGILTLDNQTKLSFFFFFYFNMNVVACPDQSAVTDKSNRYIIFTWQERHLNAKQHFTLCSLSKTQTYPSYIYIFFFFYEKSSTASHLRI